MYLLSQDVINLPTIRKFLEVNKILLEIIEAITKFEIHGDLPYLVRTVGIKLGYRYNYTGTGL